jgi:hypothetical protein
MDPDATSLKDIERRQPKYWSMDGLPQLVTGVGWVLWGSVYLIGLSLLEGRSYRLYWGIATGCVLFWGIAVQGAINKLKERMTYPRVGYAQMPLSGRIAVAVYVAALLVLGAWSLSLMDLRIDLHGFGPFVVCGVLAFAIAVPAMQPWPKHDVSWGNLLMLAVGLAMVLKVRDKALRDSAIYWTLACMGVVSIVFGALRLRRFLRENPKVAETEA